MSISSNGDRNIMANIVLVGDNQPSSFTKEEHSRKKNLIGKIVEQLHISATLNNKKFVYSDVFFSLAFKSMSELEFIAKQAKVI